MSNIPAGVYGPILDPYSPGGGISNSFAAAAAPGTLFYLQPIKTFAYTAQNYDEVPCDTTKTAFTGTLPYASYGARVRWINVARTGTNALTIVAAKGDAFIGTFPLVMTPGESIELRCYIPGFWSLAIGTAPPATWGGLV